MRGSGGLTSMLSAFPADMRVQVVELSPQAVCMATGRCSTVDL